MPEESSTHKQTSTAEPITATRRPWRFVLVGVICLLIVLTLGFVGTRLSTEKQPLSPVPAVISQSSPFPVYYPDPAKLPAGYSLNKESFSLSNDTVLYSISGPKDTLVVTIQKKPSDDDLKAFYFSRMPLRQELKTNAGTASIGAIDNQSIVSLPTKDGAWLLITSPVDTDQKALDTVLKAMTK